MKNKKGKAKIYKGIIACYLLISILAPLLANNKPLFFSSGGKNYFPAFSNDPYIELTEDGKTENHLTNSIDWNLLAADVIIFAPVRWSPHTSDLNNVYVSPFGEQHIYRNEQTIQLPFSQRHYLGTGRLGNDTLSGLIHGTRISILIGFLSTTIALLLGLFFGGIAGYFGDYTLKIARHKLIITLLLLLPAWFYGFYLRSGNIISSFNQSNVSGVFQVFLSTLIFAGIIVLPFIFRINLFRSKEILIPADSIISRFIEIFIALPRLILILTIAAIVRPSIGMVIFLIGITSWTEIARLVRSQLLQLRSQNYTEAAKATGMTTYRLFASHLLPNMQSQLLSIGIFGVAAAILTEAGLSFLGIGVPTDTATWGQIMFEARQHYTAWWLVLFSGIAISGLLYSLYALSFTAIKPQHVKGEK